jgi:taurine dioxygenase
MTTATQQIVTATGFGCELRGVDVREAGPQEIARLRDLLFEHGFLVVRDQNLTSAEYQAFMAAWGTPLLHVLREYTEEGFPAILRICDYVTPAGEPVGVVDGGTFWHSDMSYLPHTGIATSLYALNVSDRSGGTSFVDLRAGLALLAAEADFAPLLGDAETPSVEVIHRFGNRRTLTDPSAPRQRLSPDQHAQLPEVRHRLVEPHPVTGRRSLFALAGSAMEVAGVPAPRSRELLDRAEDLVLAELPVHVHRYRRGDLVIWDNMSTLHRGTDVRPTTAFADRRLLHRINVHYADRRRDAAVADRS